jgi:hypothetical protein
LPDPFGPQTNSTTGGDLERQVVHRDQIAKTPSQALNRQRTHRRVPRSASMTTTQRSLSHGRERRCRRVGIRALPARTGFPKHNRHRSAMPQADPGRGPLFVVRGRAFRVDVRAGSRVLTGGRAAGCTVVSSISPERAPPRSLPRGGSAERDGSKGTAPCPAVADRPVGQYLPLWQGALARYAFSASGCLGSGGPGGPGKAAGARLPVRSFGKSRSGSVLMPQASLNAKLVTGRRTWRRTGPSRPAFDGAGSLRSRRARASSPCPAPADASLTRRRRGFLRATWFPR